MMADWIALDWGTTRLRAWAMDRHGAVLDMAASDVGMGTIDRDGFEPALLALIEPWLGPSRMTRVMACGMVGARQGWAEAPYLQAPCAPLSRGLTEAPVTDSRISVHILPGVMQTDPPDVMRGEEVQIAGFLSQTPDYEGLLCLPGTHSKWVQVRGGRIETFQTFMTGELFALLSTRSVLRHGMDIGEWDDAAFLAGVADAFAASGMFVSQLFSLRAGSLIAELTPGAAISRLSGLLIGSELAATQILWTRLPVTIIGAERLNQLYSRALASRSGPPQQINGEAMTLAGLGAAYALIGEPSL